MLKKIASIVGVVVMVGFFAVNLLGGLASGIWLAVLGKWSLIGLGFLLGFLMPMAFGLLQMPAMAVIVVASKAAEAKGGKFPLVAAVPTSIYTSTLICAWVVFVFVFFEAKMGADSPWPFLLWAYSTAMSPLAYMASGERRDNVEEGLGTSMGFMAAMAVFLVLLVVRLATDELSARLWAGVAVGVVSGLTTMILTLAIERARAQSVF